MNQHKDKFVTLLEELFQLNQPELDFGLYRILHARSAQIKSFVQNELKEEIDKVFASQTQASAHDLLKSARLKVEQTLGEYALEANGDLKPELKGTPIGKDYELARKQAQEGGGPLADDARVYDHLYRFFSRYYDKGDFMSKRYFVSENDSRAAPYAIPYDGREVMLHWANKDQYYIKSSEYLANYTVDLAAAQILAQPGAQGGLDFAAPAKPLKVHFRLAAASEGEHNNVKEGQERYFLIHAAEPVKLESNAQGQNELVVQFQYRPDPEKTGQGGTWQLKRLAEAEAMVREHLVDPPEAKPFADALFTLAPTDKQPNRSLLAKYLGQYTSRNTMDYFIHKNLGGFLRRELDFYIKNEVMRLDDIEAADAPRVESYLKKLQSLRKIARRIIDFLAQIEDFQKKLWLKKKFVVETNYCITLDKISERFYPEITSNKQQLEEWGSIFALDELRFEIGQVSYNEPLPVDFLKTNPQLVLDTRHFSNKFNDELIASLENLSENTHGLLIHSENFQALNSLQSQYKNRIKCIYIDPPYNTGSDGFVYKDSFKASSWLSMIQDRLFLAKNTLRKNGILFSSINEIERSSLESQLKETFGNENFVAELIWARDTVSNNSPTYSKNHEYIEVCAKDKSLVEDDKSMFRETRPGYYEVMDLIETIQADYPSVTEIQNQLKLLYDSHKSDYRKEAAEQGESPDEAAKSDSWKGLYPYKFAEYRDQAGKYVDEGNAANCSASIRVFREVEPSMPSGKQADSIHDQNSENYRFYKPLDPSTGVQCMHPKRGWSFPQKTTGSRPSLERHIADKRIVFKGKELIPQLKYFLHEVETVVSTSVIRQYSDGEPKLEELFGKKGLIENPKPPGLIEKLILQTTKNNDIFLDFFAGSGTSAQAVINLNRKDLGERKFILIEMGNHFHSTLLPRVKKCIYSPTWSMGKPLRPCSEIEIKSSPKIVKVIRLESYEDTLNNLVLPKDAAVDTKNPANSDLAREYLLKYWLDFETAGSPSLLNMRQFADPTNYTLMVKQPGSDAQVAKKVDLVETFNWLIGLHVALLDQPRRYQIELVHEIDPDLPKDQDTRWVSKGIKEREDGEFWFRWVEGHVLAVPGDESSRQRILVLWRKLTGDAGRDQAALEAYLAAKKLNPLESEFDFIYINGSHALPSDGSASTRVRLIEETFAQRMWEDV
jgi:adenine-specific DNA-methyltransferase